MTADSLLIAPKILIVEDENLVAMDMEMQLLAFGYEIAGTAGTGREALALVEISRPDLVLMDVNLRGTMNGIATATEIKRRINVPIVFVTAFGNEDLLRGLRTVSSCEALMKPYRPEDLCQIIKAALQLQGATSSNPRS